jgi:hypothetical protein
MEKIPLSSVIDPDEVPFTNTVANPMGSPLLSSNTIPLILPVCEKETDVFNINSNNKKHLYFATINF